MEDIQPQTVSGLSELSSVTTTSSRTEHMNYLTTELGLDQTTAALLYRAERLHEKGQLEQALKFYKRVLKSKPDCSMASENARMVEEALTERSPKSNRMATVPEASSFGYTTTEMHVDWFDIEDIQCNYYPDADKAAFSEARSQLMRSKHGGSLLKLLENESKEKCDAETGWLWALSGRALFQVTLIPDPKREKMSDRKSKEEVAELVKEVMEEQGKALARANENVGIDPPNLNTATSPESPAVIVDDPALQHLNV